MLFGKHVNKFYIKYGLFFLLGVTALIVVDFFQLEIPEIVGKIVDGLEAKELSNDTLKELMFRMMVIALVMFAGRFLWRICIFGNGIKIESDLRNDMFKHMEKLSQKYYAENNVGQLMALYTNDLNMIRQTFGMGTIMLVDALCLGTLALIKMFKLNVLLTVVSLSSLIIITVFASIFGKKITKYTKTNFEVYGRLTNFVQETFSGIGVVKAFVLEKIQMARFGKRDIENMNSTLDITKASAIMNTIINTILSLVNITIIGYGAYVIYSKSNGDDVLFTIGDLTKFIAYFGTLIWPIESVGRLINLRSQGVASLSRVSSVLDREPIINDNLVEEHRFHKISGKIEYRDLSFAYPDGDNKRNVLNNITFTINDGEFVGVIGATGSGKTTIVDLLKSALINFINNIFRLFF